MSSSISKDIGDLLVEYGFCFDVALQGDGSVRLVEVDLFGALSGCGIRMLIKWGMGGWCMGWNGGGGLLRGWRWGGRGEGG